MSRSLTINRRNWLGLSAAITFGATQAPWMRSLAAEVAANPTRTKSVIVLWLSGGPATIDMWDLKPGHENGGPSREIETATPGMRISENFPLVAQHSSEMAIVRSMATKEGDHGRATFLAMTGYIPQGALQFPAVGSLVAHELGKEGTDLPNFVTISPRRNAGTLGGGFLGPRYSPLVVGERVGQGPGAADDNLKVPNLSRPTDVSETAQTNRLTLLGDLEKEFSAGQGQRVVETMQSAIARAVSLMRPEAAKTFLLDDEDAKLRDAYGRNNFGQGCLLARRLVERGVPFVEVTLDGWDTHNANFDRVKTLSGTLDAAFATLLNDLKQRGLLVSTLVLCMGEFGRTPKINGNAGRDHWPQSWSTVLAGGGIRGGQVIGKTAADGMSVTDRPVSIPDLIATVCKTVGIDPMKQNISNVSRPIRIADPEAQPITEIL
ncbi:MAG TPA: DUF1501 domain-containing protein [Pirellulaceae bacterium]|nr:DUF1501 domain-containing protein [Pirellulaceae bacterium]